MNSPRLLPIPLPGVRARASLVRAVRAAFAAIPALVLTACAAGDAALPAPGEVVFSYRPASWFEDAWTRFEVAPDGGRAVFGTPLGPRLVDLATGDARAVSVPGVERIAAAAFGPDGLRVLGTSGQGRGWHQAGGTEAVLTDFPPGGGARWSPDGARVAFPSPAGPPRLLVGVAGALVEHELGDALVGHAWAADGGSVFALVRRADGSSSLLRVTAGGGDPVTVRDGLDSPGFTTIGVHPDGAEIYLSLAGTEPPDNEARHDPDAARNLDIYALDLATGGLTPVVTMPGDDLSPQVVGGWLYWTHNDFRDDVVVLEAAGGDPRVVVADGQIPYWTHDSRGIAFTVGPWRVADWALNLDAAMVDVDGDARATSAPRRIVTGYHEDFTPAFSPDGRWMVYHSHRSAGPVHAYAGPGSTDDLYLLPVGGSMDQEVRLTDFGWEVGMADWAPDSRRLVFDSWERGGEPGLGKPWIVTIDPTTGTTVSVQRLPLPDGVRGTLLQAWSPDGERIAFIERVDRERQALWTVRADGSAPRRLTGFESFTYGGLDWTADGEGLVYAALADGRMQLFRIPAAGGEPVRLTATDSDLIHPQVSPDGRWIAATQVRHVKELRRSAIR